MRRFVRAQQPRDSQRARVYRAETEAFGIVRANGGTCASIGVVRDYLQGVLADDWFRSEFGGFAYVKIKDGRGTRHAYSAYEAKARGVVFSFPRWARTKPVLLHELSHAASLQRYGRIAAHGPEFLTCTSVTKPPPRLIPQINYPPHPPRMASSNCRRRPDVIVAEQVFGGVSRSGGDEASGCSHGMGPKAKRGSVGSSPGQLGSRERCQVHTTSN